MTSDVSVTQAAQSSANRHRKSANGNFLDVGWDILLRFENLDFPNCQPIPFANDRVRDSQIEWTP